MPIDRDNEHLDRSAASFRKQLIDATGGADIDAQPFELRVSNVPLFRRNGGELHQAVRVRVRQSGDGQPLTVRLLRDTTVLDVQKADPVNIPQSVFLLVPEVSAPVSLKFEAESNGSVMASIPFEVTSQRKWTIHLIHHSHYDIGYTDPQSEVMASQLSFIDAALELATITDDWPEDARFRWNIEVNWPLKQWLRTRPKHARETLLERIREGRIEVHALPFSMHTEAYSFDELARQLTFTNELREQYGIEVISAMQTDVPGATIGLATLLTDAGVKYFSVAHNFAGRSIPHLRDGQKLTRPFYWKAPDGERLLVWYTDTLHGSAYMEAMTLGFGSGYHDVVSSLPEYLNALAQRPYPYGHGGDWLSADLAGLDITREPYPHDILHLRVQGAFADNASASLVPSEIAREWNQQWEYPHLRMSLDRDFFMDAEQRLGDQMATYEGDWTDWWADGIGSAAIALGKNRQSQDDIRTAQTLNALADIITDEPIPEQQEEIERAYEEMALFDEHTWGAADPWERGASGRGSGEYQWTRKAAFAFTAEERVRALLDGGLRRIAPLGVGSRAQADLDTLMVFNPSSFARTDLARVFLPERTLEPASCELIDLSTGDTVPFVLEPQPNANYRPRGQYIRFLARDIPPIGYARYGLRPNGASSDQSATANSGIAEAVSGIDNGLLGVELDVESATIRHLVDRSTGYDLVPDNAPFGFNAYVYDGYASAPGFNHLSGRLGPAGSWLLGSRGTGQYGLVTSRYSNEVWERITIRYGGNGADWLETTLTLPHGVPRLHISNRLHKPATMQKESVYFAFPFAIEDPDISFEITGGTASNDSPRVPGSAHYFRAIRHWATLTAPGSQPIAWATNEAPLVQVGNIHIPYAPFPTTIPEHEAHDASIYSWTLNNIWDTNFPAQQGGEMTFHYTVATGNDADAATLGRDTGAANSTPLVGIAAPLGAPGRDDLPDRSSFISIAHPAIEVSHMASSRDGKGVTVFVESHASEPVETELTFTHLPVRGARTGTFLETDLHNADVRDNTAQLNIAPGALISVVLDLDM